MSTYLKEVRERCICENCERTCPGITGCDEETFMTRIYILVLDILSLSLLDCLELLQVAWATLISGDVSPSMVSIKQNGFCKAVASIANHGTSSFCTHLDVMERVLRRLGHRKAVEEESLLVMSSSKGQTV